MQRNDKYQGVVRLLIICELQPVSVQAGSEQPNEKEISDIMGLIEVTKSDLNDQQFELRTSTH
jgi:hypothetical protein